jgi:HlyD family secretion protein
MFRFSGQSFNFLLPVAGVLAVLGIACRQSSTDITPVRHDITESVYASGVVKAGGQYEVFSSYSGILVQNLVRPGDTVSKGAPLFVVDNTISSLTVENARISAELMREKTGPASNMLLELEKRLSLAKEKMTNDSMLFVRQQNLWNQQVGSQLDLEKRSLAYSASVTEFESLRLQFSQTKSELEKSYRQALNNLRISEKQQDDFTVRSSINGTVYSTLREPGEWIGFQTPLGVVGETGRYELELQVDEYDIVKVKPDQRIFITMDSYRGQMFEAKVNRIEPFLNPRTRTFTIYATFVTTPEIIYPNLSVEANILTTVHENALTIPASHLVRDKFVIMASGDTVEVKTGIRNLQWVEILDGLTEGSLIRNPLR